MATTDRSGLAGKILAVRRASGAGFVELVRIAGLDRATAFRHSDLSGVDLRGQDLRGFDFTGADLRKAKLDRSSLVGAITTDALIARKFRSTNRRRTAVDELAWLSDAGLLKMIRNLPFDAAAELLERIDKLDRSNVALLAELVGLAPDEDDALKAIRTYFRLHWAGPSTFPIVKKMIAGKAGPSFLDEAVDFLGYVPAGPAQVEALLKVAGDFGTANFVYKRFARLCSEPHLKLLGRHVRSPSDYEHLHELAGVFSEGKRRRLVALRALPSAAMVKSALAHHTTEGLAEMPDVQVILAGKVESAEEALAMLEGGGMERPLIKMLDAAVAALKPREAFRLMKTFTGDETPIRVGGDIWATLILTVYLKRSDIDWRWSMFDEYIQWGFRPELLRSPSIRKQTGFRDVVELAAMFASVVDLDLEEVLSPFVENRRDERLLESGLNALRIAGALGSRAVIEAFRAELRIGSRSRNGLPRRT
ncbi:pentapeptide repeat-containing protein [Devosia sediminis]|uniref:Pentapeptide repeat-containing protein n=1 Tax=Devosia sediminis TaxID=2798801 RepID=A0A934J1X7_9HYPH|nr:pentapeptide repeat-containing protein [Devosia sediminis]MBJ3786357.1 pentapeptide repeat-containing protein [Devosia sediminis]